MFSPLHIRTERCRHGFRCELLFAVLLGFCGVSAEASILWDGDAATHTPSQAFSSLNVENQPGEFNVVSDPTFGSVFQFVCYNPTNGMKTRTEGSHMKNFQPVPGGNYYFGWRHKWGPLPTKCGKWQVLEQIHLAGTGATGGPVPFGLHVDGCDTDMHFQYQDATGTPHDFLVLPFPLNSWHSFVYHELWSESETDGYVEFWYDGVMQTLANGTTRYPSAWCFPDSTSYWKWGVYRSGSAGLIGTAYAYLWRPRAGTTYTDVDPVGASDFSIAGTPASQATVPGGSAVYTVTIGTATGFTGTVGLTAIHLPSGATANFNPPSIVNTGNSTLTITTDAGMPLGNSVFSIVGTSGTLAHTNTLTLVVAGYALAATPAAQTVVAGNSTNYTVVATTNSSFSGGISFSILGLPTAASAGFSPISLAQSGTSTLTVNTTTNTPGGTYMLTIRGTDGATVVSTNVALTVNGVVSLPGTLVWTSGSGAGTNWSTLLNWTNGSVGGYGPPGVSNSVVFTNTASVPDFITIDDVVDSSAPILSLAYTQTNRVHNTLILPGNKLTIATNLSVGTGSDLGINGAMFASIQGVGGSLVVTNTNCVVNVRQGTENGSGPYAQRAWLDLSGLDTFNAKASRMLIAADGGGTSREVGTLYLARTNVITLYGAAPSINLGENPSNGAGANNDPTPLTSYLYLGRTNAIFVNSMGVGRSKAAGALKFNAVFTDGGTPFLYLRGVTGGRVSTLSIADESPLGTSNQRSLGTVDLSTGTVDAMIDTVYVGRSMNGNNSGTTVGSAGTLTFEDGTMDVNTLEVGYQTSATGTGPGCLGTVNVNGDGLLVVHSLLELTHGNVSSPAEQGVLNLNGGTVRSAHISGGGGLSTINLNSGTMDLQSGNLAAVSVLNVGKSGVADVALLTGAASVSVSNLIVVAANGVISGDTILTDAGLVVNGQIAPGNNSAGGLTNNASVTFGAGGSLAITVEDAAAGPVAGWGFFAANAIDVQSASGSPFVISVQTGTDAAANFNYGTNYDWVIATAGGGISNFDPAKFAVDSSQFANDIGGGYFYVRAAGNSLILSFTNNHPPVAQTTWQYRTGNVMTIPLSALAARWSDPDGDPVMLVSVDAGSTNGVNNLSTDGTNIYYTNFNAVADSFGYVVQDVRTNPPAIYQPDDTVQMAAGVANILLPPALAVPAASGNSVVLAGTGGAPGGNYYVLCTTNMILPASLWTVVGTDAFDANGGFSFTNAVDITQPQRFYLLQMP